MENLLKGRGNPKKWGFCRKGGMLLVASQGIFSGWGVVNVTSVTFNDILVIVFLFLLNLGISPSFHCKILVPVYRVHTSFFHNIVASSCYRLHTSCFYHESVTCFSLHMWF